MSVKLLSPLVPPSMTTTQRNALPTSAGRQPPGALIWNSTTGRIEINLGSDAAPSWSPLAPEPAMRRLADTTLGSPALTVDMPGLAQTYAHLLIVANTRAVATGNQGVYMQLNGDTANNYQWVCASWRNGAWAAGGADAVIGFWRLGTSIGATTDIQWASHVALISDYTNASKRKAYVALSSNYDGFNRFDILGGRYIGAGAAITRLTFGVEGGAVNLDAGSRFTVYGLG